MKKFFKLIFSVLLWSALALTSCDVFNQKNDSKSNPGQSASDEQAVSTDSDALVITFASGDSETAVNGNLNLPTTGANGSAISWSSSNTAVIANDGTVTSPPFGSGDVTVTLTATITSGEASETKTFTITVKEASFSDSAAVAADKAALAITYTSGDSASSVTGNITLPASGSSGSTIIWDSSATSVIAASGTVTRPAFGSGNASVTFTATIAKGSSSDTRIFTLTVIEAPQTDAAAVAADKAALAITYAGGDSSSSVTQNITLSSSGSSGTTIIWDSSATSVIAASGTVTRPAFGSGNASVTFTATITKGGASDTKLFTLTVIEAPQTDAQAVAADKAALAITYAGGDSSSSVTQNITLPTAGSSGTTISWSSNNTVVISNSGAVTRPSIGNAGVTLTATITKNSASDTKTFALTVIAQAALNRYVKSGGTDSGDCSNSSTPCATIAYAISQSSAGDNIAVAAGTYTISSTIVMASGVSLYGGFNPTSWARDISANETIIDDTRNSGNFSTISASSLASAITIDGFTIKASAANASTNNQPRLINISSTQVTISNNILEQGAAYNDAQYGIYISGNKSAVIKNNRTTMKENGTPGTHSIRGHFSVYVDSTANADIYNNVLYHESRPMNFEAAIYIAGTGTKNVRNNTIAFYGNGLYWSTLPDAGSGISINGTVTVNIENNIIYAQGATQSQRACVNIAQTASAPASLKNNDFFQCGNAIVRIQSTSSPYTGTLYTTITDVNNLTYADNNVEVDLTDGSNTYFVNETSDWHLTSSVLTSITTGGLDGVGSSFGFTTDKDGTTRTGNGTTGWSIGAYEKD